MVISYLIQWGSLFPPFYKYGVLMVCGFEICWSALSLAVGQQYYEYSEILFPIAFDVFEETAKSDLRPENFTWTDSDKDALMLCQTRLQLLWFTSTITALISMLFIIPYFFKCEKQLKTERFFSVYILMWFCAAIFLIISLGNGAIFSWIYTTAPSDNDLFFSKFNKVEIGEEYVTRIEQGFHCNSDEDLENIPVQTTCEFSIRRSVINRQLLTPLLYIWIYGHGILLILFGFLNKDFGSDGDANSEDVGRLI